MVDRGGSSRPHRDHPRQNAACNLARNLAKSAEIRITRPSADPGREL